MEGWTEVRCVGAVGAEIVGGVVEMEMEIGYLGGCGMMGLLVRWMQSGQSKEDCQAPCRVLSPQWGWVEVEGLPRLRVHKGCPRVGSKYATASHNPSK